MDPNFRLIKLVDPSKSVTKINDRFAKLTLSSTRKKQGMAAKQKKAEMSAASRSHISRRLVDDFLTDDESDSEADALNQIFRSKTTAKTSDPEVNEPQPISEERRSKSFSQHLQLSDSDETNCSIEAAKDDEENVQPDMEKLALSPSQPPPVQRTSSKLFTDSTPTDADDVPVLQLSSRFSSLGINSNAEPAKHTSDERIERDAELENIFRRQKPVKTEGVIESGPHHSRMSIVTISSTVASSISADEDEDSDIVVISESSEDEGEEDYYPVSGTNGSVAFSETMRHRLDAFFENIPTLPSNEGPENIIIRKAESGLISDKEPSIPIDESIPAYSIEICESPDEHEDEETINEVLNDEAATTPRMLLRSAIRDTPPMSPRKTVTSPSPRQARTAKQLVSTEIDQKLASPRKAQTPRKTAATTPIRTANSPREARQMATTSKRYKTPQKRTPKVKSAASPLKLQAPQRATTPKVSKKAETPRNAQEQKPVEEKSATSSAPVPPSYRSSDENSTHSTEYRIERINISATIKIKLQFNEDGITSVDTTPLTSTSTTRFPRLTESESTIPPRSSTQNTEDQVHTPDNLKQRSIREPGALTFLDITRSGLLSQTSTIKESSYSEPQVYSSAENVPAQVETPLETNQPQEDICQASIANPVHDIPPSPSSPFKEAQIEIPPLQEVLPQVESTPHRQLQSRPTISVTGNLPIDDNPGVEIDDNAQKLLDQLYGNAWKTPDVVKALKKVNNPRLATNKATIDETVVDFTKFHRNIRCDLESTRLAEVQVLEKKTPGSIFKVPASDRKVLRSRKDVSRRAASERKPAKGDKVQTPTDRIKAICDSDSSFEDKNDFDASSDESWRDVFSYSSNSDESDNEKEAPSTRKCTKKTKKKTKKNSSKDDLIYLDLSSDVVKVQEEVSESPIVNKDEAFQERLQTLLDTYKYTDKKKPEETPRNNKIKRKLFTPRFGEEDEVSPVRPTRRECETTDDGVVTLDAPLPAIYDPINKHLESVKTGKPIFSIKTPSFKVPSSTRKNKENFPFNDIIGITPQSTPKSQSRNARGGTSAVALLSTPFDKYGFLQSLGATVDKKFCHPDALYYRENYKAKRNELADKLYEIYNKHIFNGELDVPLQWNKKLLNTAGRCSCSTKRGKRFSRIELSEKVLTSPDRLRCTLIHELCHAATWIYNGEHGHGVTWKNWARRANSIFPELPKIGVCHEYDIDYKYTYKCTLCNAKSHAHSKSKKVENIRCAYCHGAIEVFLNKKDKDGNVLPTPVKEPTGFAKFVKENYKKHKRPELKHADVMKLLSNEFAALNIDRKK